MPLVARSSHHSSRALLYPSTTRHPPDLNQPAKYQYPKREHDTCDPKEHTGDRPQPPQPGLMDLCQFFSQLRDISHLRDRPIPGLRLRHIREDPLKVGCLVLQVGSQLFCHHPKRHSGQCPPQCQRQEKNNKIPYCPLTPAQPGKPSAPSHPGQAIPRAFAPPDSTSSTPWWNLAHSVFLSASSSRPFRVSL